MRPPYGGPFVSNLRVSRRALLAAEPRSWSAALLFIVITGAAEADRGHRRPIPSILLSTDVALGVSGTHGGKSLSPVVIPEDASQGNKDPEKVPADIDDGLTLTMAINLARDRKLRLLAVVPIFGNATLPAAFYSLSGSRTVGGSRLVRPTS